MLLSPDSLALSGSRSGSIALEKCSPAQGTPHGDLQSKTPTFQKQPTDLVQSHALLSG